MMADTINKVCVIGAGVMGAGIAAQVANAGVPVLLLDIVPKDGADRDAVAKGAVAKMLKTEPAPFMSPTAAKLVFPHPSGGYVTVEAPLPEDFLALKAAAGL